MGILKDLLDEYRVTKDFQKEVREGYRIEIEEHLRNSFDTKCYFRYGGSLAKATANKNKCDIDLLSYLENDTNMSLKSIYETSYNSLMNDYFCERKNSAITVHNKYGEQWDYTVDVVPGKFSSNDSSSDVYLWQNRTGNRLKTNPEIQITKVKESNSKDVIRLIKIYRDSNNFKFKSFFLEIFAIDVIEPDYSDQDSLYDKIVKFCSRFSDIGVIKIYDPANSNNNIMNIHDERQYSIIRDMVKTLHEVMMTDDEDTIKNCILGNPFNIDDAYKNKIQSRSIMQVNPVNAIAIYQIQIQGYIVGNYEETFFTDYTEIKKGVNLYFSVNILKSMGIYNVRWIVTNSGYEAKKHNCLRGEVIEESSEIKDHGHYKKYIRREATAYYGNHFVQAVLTTKTGAQFYSNIVIVKVR